MNDDKVVKMLKKHDTDFARIDDKFDRVYEELADHKHDIEWIKENMATKHDLAKIYEILDRILAMTTSNAQERGMLGCEIERHDTRITRLEQTVGVV